MAGLIDKLSEDNKLEASKSAYLAADALLGFLDGMMEAHKLKRDCCHG